MPHVTVMLGSDRPGGIDIVLAGLVGQTFQDFEVVFVDGRYHKRHTAVLEAVKASGLKQPFFHVPNHRYSGGVWGNPCSGYNTGFALAEGHLIVMLLDYAYAPPGWLQAHVDRQISEKIVMAPHEYRFMTGEGTEPFGEKPLFSFTKTLVDSWPVEIAMNLIAQQKEKFDEISIFAEPFETGHLERFAVDPNSDAKCHMLTAPCMYTYFNTKNESFPRWAVEQANGMDEHYDLGRGPGDPDLCWRMSQFDLVPWTVNEAIVHCINPRLIMPNINIVIPENGRLMPPFEKRWYIQDGYAYFESVRSGGYAEAYNPIGLSDLRESLKEWRALSQETEPVIPKNVIPDEVYWKGFNYDRR